MGEEPPQSPPPSSSHGDAAPEVGGVAPADLFKVALESGVALQDWNPPEVTALAKLLPQFRIESLLGRGGMGAVYKGHQLNLDRPVAIKLLPAELARDEDFAERFKREAKLLAKLRHPGIVGIYDFGQTSKGHLYFVMELVDGVDLDRVIHGGGLEPSQSLSLVSQICGALQYAHSEGFIHRDIKPANVLVTSDGIAKLADFGLARHFAQESSLTGDQKLLGTYDYMAPEQRKGVADHRSDIYAVGLMFYEMLTGERPEGIIKPPSARLPVDVRLDNVVAKALEKEPEQRYQQASEMKSDVDEIRDSPDVGETKSAFTRVLGKPWLISTIAAVIIAGAIGFGILLFKRSTGLSPEGGTKTESSSLWSGPHSSQLGPNRILDARLSPPPPANLKIGDKVRLTYAYQTDQSGPIGISATPLSDTSQGVRPPPFTSTGGSSLMPDQNNPQHGTATYEFIVNVPTRTQRVGITMRSASTHDVLAYLTIPAEYRFEDPDHASAKAPEASASPTLDAPNASTLKQIEEASKEHPFANSLGMKFVPVTGAKVLFCIWDTRVKDFTAFMNGSGYNWSEGELPGALDKSGFQKHPEYSWNKPGFVQSDEHPVVCVSWRDAQAFCLWLTRKEGVVYRLPTDQEWSVAAGIGDREDPHELPKSKNGKLTDAYLWGSQWPPPAGAGNFAGSEFKIGEEPQSAAMIEGYRDDFARTSPVGSFSANLFGLCDMAGNVWQMCQDPFDINTAVHPLRGGSWFNSRPVHLNLSCRGFCPFALRGTDTGFRVVLMPNGY